MEQQQTESQPRHEAEERAVQIRANLHQDMHTRLVAEGLRGVQHVIDWMCDEAMFQIEHLLVEIEALHIKDRAKSGSVDRTEWHRD